MRIVGCYLTYKDTFLLLHRHAHKPDGNTWGLPGGKVDPGEDDQTAVIRELFEETGYKASADQLSLIGEYEFISSRGEPYVYVTYEVNLETPHNVVLEEHAHSEYKWTTYTDADKQKDLIDGLHTLFRWTNKIT